MINVTYEILIRNKSEKILQHEKLKKIKKNTQKIQNDQDK